MKKNYALSLQAKKKNNIHFWDFHIPSVVINATIKMVMI